MEHLFKRLKATPRLSTKLILQRGFPRTRVAIIREQNEAAMDGEAQAPGGTDTFSQQECTLNRRWEAAVVPQSFDPRPSLWTLLGQLRRKQMLRATGITFVTCEKPPRPELQEPSCQRMLHSLGLHEFYLRPVPDFDAELCHEFISTYAHPYCYGIVDGRAVSISIKQVKKLTGLPAGDWKLQDYELKGNNRAVLQGVLRTLKQKKPGLYSLDHLQFGDRSESRAFKLVAQLLMERFLCKPHPAGSVAPQLILSMHGSLRHNMVMKWAQVFVTRLCKAVFYSRMKGSYPFFYGEWLTGLIKQQLRCDDEWEVDLTRKMKPELETTLKDLAKMEMDTFLIESKIQALEKKLAAEKG